MNQFDSLTEVFFDNRTYFIYTGEGSYPEQPYENIRNFNSGEGFMTGYYNE